MRVYTPPPPTSLNPEPKGTPCSPGTISSGGMASQSPCFTNAAAEHVLAHRRSRDYPQTGAVGIIHRDCSRDSRAQVARRRVYGVLLLIWQKHERRHPTACTRAWRDSSKCACRHARTSSSVVSPSSHEWMSASPYTC